MLEITEYSGGSGGVSGGSGGLKPPLPLRPWGEQVGCCWVKYDENGKVIAKEQYCIGDIENPIERQLLDWVRIYRNRPIGEWPALLRERGFPQLCSDYCKSCCGCNPLEYPAVGTVRPEGGWDKDKLPK